MATRAAAEAILALAAAAILAAGCGDKPRERTDDDGDGEDDETGCECSSEADNFCIDATTAMQCFSGCFLQQVDCFPNADESGCEDGECWGDWDDDGGDGEWDSDTPYFECNGPEDNYCADDSTLIECDYYLDVGSELITTNCANPSLCPGGSGCALNDDGIAACWCDETAGGVGDGGVEDSDAGADGGIGDSDAGTDAGE